MKLNENLKKLLFKSDLSLSQLARETGIARQTLDNWLSGQDPRSLTQLKVVADYFGLSIDELCFGDKLSSSPVSQYEDEINAGVFEVVLRRVKK